MSLPAARVLAVLLAVLLAALAAGPACSGALETRRPIRVGVLHSLTGTMAVSEGPVKEATLLAIEELNARGGVLGRLVEPVVVDGRSDWDVFAGESARLLDEEGVAAVFGCWTSASRKTVGPVFEERGGVLFYPVQYEGVESSPNIVYLGAAPNQQIVPALVWAVETREARRFFLVGSDYVFPRTANAILRDYAEALGAEIVGEEYLPLGSTQVGGIVGRIRETRPDMILNTINGDSNAAFFRALREGGIESSEIPTISFSIAEPELASMDIEDLAGDYAAWNYFMSVESQENKRFVEALRRRSGEDAVASDPLEAAYTAVHLWALAAEDAGSVEPAAVLDSIRSLGFEAPGGRVYIDQESRHAWKTVRIGRIRPDAQFEVVWSSGAPVRPVPYPRTRTREQWQSFLEDLRESWGGAWAAPAGEGG